MSKRKPSTASSTGVVFCAPCPPKERERIIARLGGSPLAAEFPAGETQVAALADKVVMKGFDRVLLAGVSPTRHAELLRSFARRARLAPGAVLGLDLGPALRAKNRPAAVARAVQQGLAALAESPRLETRRDSLEQAVLGVGGGPAGLQAASALHALGHPVTIVEKDPSRAAGFVRQAFDLKGATLLADSRVRQIEGQVGGFRVTVATPQGEKRLACGAVVLATGQAAPGAEEQRLFRTAGVVPLAELAAAASRLPRRKGPRPLALVLDYRFEETKGSMEAALRNALPLQEKGFQVHLFCRDARVAAMELEKLYDQARGAGVDIVKYEGALTLAPGTKAAVRVACRDAVLGQPLELEFELAGVSRCGVASGADAGLAGLFGVRTDGLGQLQDNNIHLFPGQTNRAGIYAAGACRGQFYLPQLEAEARAVALEIHALLCPGSSLVELAQPVVDPDKCALCLTCIRSCPHGAMYVDRAKAVAACAAEACRRCGICAGECPAKAIELPAWSDRLVLSQVR